MLLLWVSWSLLDLKTDKFSFVLNKSAQVLQRQIFCWACFLEAFKGIISSQALCRKIKKYNLQWTWITTSQTSCCASLFTSHLYFPESSTLTLLNCKLDQRPDIDSDVMLSSHWPFVLSPSLVHLICLTDLSWTTEQFRTTVSSGFTVNSVPWKVCRRILQKMSPPFKPSVKYVTGWSTKCIDEWMDG